MKKLMILFFVALSFSSYAQNNNTPNHCQVASDKVREAANNFGNGNLGDAAHNLGEAAGAAHQCVRDKIVTRREDDNN